MRKIILAILIMIAITFIGLYTNNNLKNKIILKNESSSNILITNALTMMYETEIDSGEYQVSNGVSWSTDEYKFNEELSKCENGGRLIWNDGTKKITMQTNTSDKCYVLF